MVSKKHPNKNRLATKSGWFDGKRDATPAQQMHGN
jgi:hypothetical protein